MIRRRAIFAILPFFVLGFTFSAAAQDAFECSFEVDRDATAFSDMQVLTDQDIPEEVLQTLALDIRMNPDLSLAERLSSYDYSPEIKDTLLNGPGNQDLVERLLAPARSRAILDRAYAVLADYGLPSSALVELYPLAGDYDELYSALVGRGLSPELAQGLATDAGALMQEAQSLGLDDYSLTLDVSALFAQYDDPFASANNWHSISDVLDEPEALRAKLASIGVPAGNIDLLVAGLDDLRERGLNERYMSGWEVETMAYTMEYYGLPGETLMAMAGTDVETVRGCLSDAGLDESLLDAPLIQFDEFIFSEDAPLDLEEIETYVIDEAAHFLEDWDLTPDDFTALMENADDPEALELMLEQAGYSPDEIDQLIESLDQSSFESILLDELPEDMQEELLDAYDTALEEEDEDDFNEDDFDDEDADEDDDLADEDDFGDDDEDAGDDEDADDGSDSTDDTDDDGSGSTDDTDDDDGG